MVEKEYIAYEGEFFTVEWFFDENDYSQSLEYAESLTDNEKAKLIGLFRLISETGAIRNIEKFRNEGEQIYAFKPKPHRFLCFFFEGRKIIITNAFEKRQDKLPSNEKYKALDYKKSYEKRIAEGIYYE